MYQIIKKPDIIRTIAEQGTEGDIRVATEIVKDELVVSVTADRSEPRYVILRWLYETQGAVQLLGDAWERSYGDLAWRGIEPDRAMPWYFLLDSKDGVYGFGVKVRPRAMCHWLFDSEGISLVLDLRCGGVGVRLQGRTIEAATVVYREYGHGDAFDAACDFCGVMSPSPLTVSEPVYGANNWYYAYGNSSYEDIISDSRYIAKLTEGLSNRPYMVIDDGWEIHRVCGPWEVGNERFPDMKQLMADMKECGVKPGIWFRPLTDANERFKDCHFLRGQKGALDPTHPDVLANIAESVSRFRDWGCQLLKHDFSSCDTTSLWGKDTYRRFVPEKDTWSFYDRTVTTAEALMTLYETIYRAADEMVVLGCNCVNHLCVGYVHLNRIGDDTSGQQWERTRFMGVNALAFRLPQHHHFFEVDADCVGVTAQVPWELNRRWLELLAGSGTPLFVSCKQQDITWEMEKDLREAMVIASQQKDVLKPLDWKYNSTPKHWLKNGQPITYSWSDAIGAFDLP